MQRSAPEQKYNGFGAREQQKRKGHALFEDSTRGERRKVGDGVVTEGEEARTRVRIPTPVGGVRPAETRALRRRIRKINGWLRRPRKAPCFNARKKKQRKQRFVFAIWFNKPDHDG